MKIPSDPKERRARAREWLEMRKHNRTKAREEWCLDRDFRRMLRAGLLSRVL